MAATSAAEGSELGGLDGLVNNAGLYYEAASWEEEPTQLRRLIEVNVLGPLLCTAAAAQIFRAQGTGGAIVNATSGALCDTTDAGRRGRPAARVGGSPTRAARRDRAAHP